MVTIKTALVLSRPSLHHCDHGHHKIGACTLSTTPPLQNTLMLKIFKFNFRLYGHTSLTLMLTKCMWKSISFWYAMCLPRNTTIACELYLFFSRLCLCNIMWQYKYLHFVKVLCSIYRYINVLLCIDIAYIFSTSTVYNLNVCRIAI